MKVLNNLDLVKNEIQNARVQNLASAPSSPVTGQVYFDTALGYLRVYNGSAWARLDSNWIDSVSGTAPIQASETSGVVTVSIDPATTSAAGSLSAADKTLIDGATSQDTASALVKRDSGKRFRAADPSDAQDVATKNYVDTVSQGLDVKQSVRAATTANITLSGTQTIDGVSVIAGNRVLVKNQSSGENNGIYVVASGSWTRATDADTSGKVTPGMFSFVEEGTSNADSGWVLTVDGSVTLGTTPLTFVQFSGAGQITAGAGLTKSGNTIDAVGTADRITVNADSIDIASTYAGQSTITTVGSGGTPVTTGVWNATAIAVAYGGTGATTAANARANLEAVGKYATNVGNNSSTDFTITHNLASRDVIVQVYEAGSPYAVVLPDVEMATTNTVTLKFATAPTTNQYRVVVTG